MPGPEVAGERHAMQARLESPRPNYATPGLRPGGLALVDGGSSRRSTVMRLGPPGQPAHIRVIRRRSRLVAALPPGASGQCPTNTPARSAHCATPLGALRAWRAGPELQRGPSQQDNP
jgi:hypothetical protein